MAIVVFGAGGVWRSSTQFPALLAKAWESLDPGVSKVGNYSGKGELILGSFCDASDCVSSKW